MAVVVFRKKNIQLRLNEPNDSHEKQDRKGTIWGSFAPISGNHRGLLWDLFGPFRGQLGVKLRSFWNQFGVFWGLLGSFPFFLGGVILGNFESYCGHFGAIGHFLDHFGVISVSF